MTQSDPSRLDRIEALLESIATDLAGAKEITISNAQAIKQIGQRVDSNARAIEALSSDRAASQQEAQQHRARLYQAMAELATSQANLYSQQASFYSRLEEVDSRQDELSRRQGDIVEILKLLTQNRERPNP